MNESKSMPMAGDENKSADRPSIVPSGFDKIISAIIFLVFFLCPVFFTGQTAQGIGFEKMIFFYFLVLVGVVAWVIKGGISGELNLKRTPLDWPILLTVALFTTSTIMSINGKDSLFGTYGSSAKSLAALIVFVLFYYLVVNNINAARIKLVFWGLVASALLIIPYSLLQLLDIYILPFNFSQAPNFNPIGSFSSLAAYILMILPILVIGATQVREMYPKAKASFVLGLKILAGAVLASGFFVLAIINGFVFWPAAIISMVVLLMFFLSKIIKITAANLFVGVVGVFIAVMFLFVLGNFNFLNNQRLPAEIGLTRSASWQIAKESLKKDPSFGSCPATFYYSFTKYKNQDYNNSPLWSWRFDSATGMFFEALATVGAAGTLALAVVLLVVLSLSFLAILKVREKDMQPLALAFFSSFLAALILAIFYPFNNVLIMVAAILTILAAAVSVNLYPEKFSDLKLSFRASPKFALALAAIIVCLSAGIVVLFTMGFKLYLAAVYARQALAAENIEGNIAKLNQAITLAPYQDAYYIALANQYMSLVNKEATSENPDQVKIQENLSRAIENGKKSVELSPQKAGNNESLGLIFENASFYTRGALEWAETYYQQVMQIDPANPVPYLRLALINMARSNAETDEEEKKFYIDEAIKKYDEALAKKADLGNAYYGKAVANERKNDYDAAIEDMKKALLVAQDSIDYRFELGRMLFNRGATKPNISQEATREITVKEFDGANAEGEGENATGSDAAVSVQKSEPVVAGGGRNDDINLAEQLFLGILQASPNHANALYSLAVIYQKVNELDKAKLAVSRLLEVVPEENVKEIIKQQFPGMY